MVARRARRRSSLARETTRKSEIAHAELRDGDGPDRPTRSFVRFSTHYLSNPRPRGCVLLRDVREVEQRDGDGEDREGDVS